jgi:hypothetical protein
MLVSGLALALLCVSGSALAEDDDSHGGETFRRIATIPNYLNNGALATATVSEIVSATADGETLVYTDSENNQIGFVDISDPSQPVPAGTVSVSGEPTSVSVLGNAYALVATNTSEDFVNVSGNLDVVAIETRSVIRVIPLGGQPDSIDISPDGRYAAIAIENERDEDIIVDGVEGGLPQLPAGYLAIVDLVGGVDDWGVRTVDVSGLSSYAPTDPEPEFVDINEDNLAVVSLQENNHIVIVDLAKGTVVGDFDAGAVTLDGVDATEDGVISLTETLTDVVREPDAVAWVPGPGKGRDRIGTANEGDLFGGSRGFSLFKQNGATVFDAGTSYEELAVRHGHYPEDRSENKGSEPESIEYGRYGDTDYLFVGSERGSFIAAFRLRRGQPVFSQVLPGPLGPEGLLAIPSRNLLVASGEEDDPSLGVRSTMMIYELSRGEPTYPQILSADAPGGSPIPWSAMSGMVAVPGEDDLLLAVWDSYYSTSKIFAIDAGREPAVVVDELSIQGGTGNYDPEGIAIAPDGTLWVASEGNASGSRPNRLLQLDGDGTVLNEIGLPPEIEACRAASTNRGSLGAGFEGLAVLKSRASHKRQRGSQKGGRASSYKLIVAQQRGWDYTTPECEDLDDDPTGANAGEPPLTRLWTYDPDSGEWGSVSWELPPLPADASWVGLSEVTLTGDDLVLIERDNRTGDFAALKTLVKVSLEDAKDGVTTDEKAVYDLIPDFLETNGWITDKPEGVAITDDGDLFVISDNDGVEDWSGETWFLPLGDVDDLFEDDHDDDEDDDD